MKDQEIRRKIYDRVTEDICEWLGSGGIERFLVGVSIRYTRWLERAKLLREMRQEWCSDMAGGRAVFSLRLDDWIKFCRNAGIKDKWWELGL